MSDALTNSYPIRVVEVAGESWFVATRRSASPVGTGQGTLGEPGGLIDTEFLPGAGGPEGHRHSPCNFRPYSTPQTCRHDWRYPLRWLRLRLGSR